MMPVESRSSVPSRGELGRARQGVLGSPGEYSILSQDGCPYRPLSELLEVLVDATCRRAALTVVLRSGL